MGANTAITSKNITTLDQHLTRSYGERGTTARETLQANAFAAYVGTMVQEYRKQNKITQQELAELLGVKKSYLSRIENGRADIRLSTLAKILSCIGFDIVAMPRI
ncbi:MAG: helix-turn-helix transcriptional regulator [Saprospiraceae bacterium]|nr:helix-turn-helix transcriptional regulator [Saprospiraceae bacterium]